MMKRVFVICISFLVFSCLGGNLSKDINCKNGSELIKSKQNRIIGLWTIYEAYSNGLSILCNSCSEVDFKSNGLGKVTLPNQDYALFKWKIEQDTLFVSYYEGIERILMGDQYLVRFNEKEDFVELHLINENFESYLLR